MFKDESYIEEVGQLLRDLEKLTLSPVLVGGMALVILGSRRVTEDFDILIAKNNDLQEQILSLFYSRGFELASKIDQQGTILNTINNQKVASIRMHLDKPSSAYFLKKKSGLRIDLLFDFPLPAVELAKRAQKKKIRSYTFYVAAREDLIRLKEIAVKNRSRSTDTQDLEFLQQLDKTETIS
ncbi:MAG: hypothetical protein COX62_08070 [Deltaproteobacteria bacterium CG_4_10_14_0_2_um_filter_43_8]|nr:MAG: hypothetical protein COV43_06560 [Deltaproteobacteria bacterium CG11_big_fil_rev_8_21_14_0_20_42_23]PJA18830.1 MAG: hypothetical protein COX62_08070 [Deltaproteobacteria bacterium CG_4_10_14_0_2_um_filter_43_8]PJC64850.1 MAG: hypothetical protein CO021_02200 [Deltaproteobacteria bacterium CG_4_9_14_0_2_um_filter_42_21]